MLDNTPTYQLFELHIISQETTQTGPDLASFKKRKKTKKMIAYIYIYTATIYPKSQVVLIFLGTQLLLCTQIYNMSSYIVKVGVSKKAKMIYKLKRMGVFEYEADMHVAWREYLSMKKTHISLSWSSHPILCAPYPYITSFHDTTITK